MTDAPERIWIERARKDRHWKGSEGECLSPHGPYMHHATVAAREERYDARIDALTEELRVAREETDALRFDLSVCREELRLYKAMRSETRRPKTRGRPAWPRWIRDLEDWRKRSRRHADGEAGDE